MQHKKTSILIVALVALFLASCSNGNESKATVENKPFVTGDFQGGTWKLDSIAESDSVIRRLDSKLQAQVFNFRKDGVFSIIDATGTSSDERIEGNWKVKGDSILFLGEKDGVATNHGYRCTFSGKRMKLVGNAPVSAEKGKKPTLFLEKVVMP